MRGIRVQAVRRFEAGLAGEVEGERVRASDRENRRRDGRGGDEGLAQGGRVAAAVPGRRDAVDPAGRAVRAVGLDEFHRTGTSILCRGRRRVGRPRRSGHDELRGAGVEGGGRGVFDVQGLGSRHFRAGVIHCAQVPQDGEPPGARAGEGVEAFLDREVHDVGAGREAAHAPVAGSDRGQIFRGRAAGNGDFGDEPQPRGPVARHFDRL